ncbi:hypothetical protein B0H13DRAFT_590109 [Mycena leptocephala]|nr:hypothetical protein B0H13DRAFT_590109 [Mycena leptocephala]
MKARSASSERALKKYRRRRDRFGQIAGSPSGAKRARKSASGSKRAHSSARGSTSSPWISSSVSRGTSFRFRKSPVLSCNRMPRLRCSREGKKTQDGKGRLSGAEDKFRDRRFGRTNFENNRPGEQCLLSDTPRCLRWSRETGTGSCIWSSASVMSISKSHVCSAKHGRNIERMSYSVSAGSSAGPGRVYSYAVSISKFVRYAQGSLRAGSL